MSAGQEVTKRPVGRCAAPVMVGLLVVAVLVAAAGPLELMRGLSIFEGVGQVQELTGLFDKLKAFLLALILAGASVAGAAVAAAKIAGHSRANDMIFNIAAGVVVLAAIPTMLA